MFIDSDFLLQNKYAVKLYHDYAENMPIFDFHNHLSAQEILDDGCMQSLTEAWLYHDHYKWRAMRAMGFEESLVTGDASDYDKYLAYVKTVMNAVGNPLYHWTHLELKRYFGITEPLTLKNAEEVYKICGEKLRSREYSVRNLLRMQNVKILCTTDDPVDDLHAHLALKEEGFEIRVLPSFRPDMVLKAENAGFIAYMDKLSAVSGITIGSIADMMKALEKRLDYFISAGCLVTDLSLEGDFYSYLDKAEAERVFSLALEGKGEELTSDELLIYRSYVLNRVAALYAQKNIVMQIHLGAIRDNNKALLKLSGNNIGCDSLHDFGYAAMLSGLLGDLSETDELPKCIVYNLNPKDNEMLATMAGNFRNVRFGPAWWFNDHKAGIEEQLRIYSRQCVLGTNIGMLTDSRSFLSYPRHEYFRRILCNYVGTLVADGEYPWDEDVLGEMMKNICYDNAIAFFRA